MTQNCYIYLNLHSKPKTFSVQINGLVQKNILAGIAENARFRVRTGGHAQAVREQVRNVHAFVVCQQHNLRVIEPMYENLKHLLVPVHYHYNDGDFFSVKWNGKWMPLDQDYVFDQVFMDNHKCYLYKTTFWEYLLKRKLTVKEFLEQISPEVTDVLIENIKYILKVKKVKILIKVSVQICKMESTTILPLMVNRLHLISKKSWKLSLITVSIAGLSIQALKITQFTSEVKIQHKVMPLLSILTAQNGQESKEKFDLNSLNTCCK